MVHCARLWKHIMIFYKLKKPYCWRMISYSTVWTNNTFDTYQILCTASSTINQKMAHFLLIYLSLLLTPLRLLAGPEIYSIFQVHPHQCWVGKIICLDPLVILCSMHPRIFLASLVARSHYWLMFNLVSTNTPRSFSAELLSHMGGPQHVLVPGVVLSRVQFPSLGSFPVWYYLIKWQKHYVINIFSVLKEHVLLWNININWKIKTN